MSRSALVGNVIAMLEDAGFAVSDRCVTRPKSFDAAARRGEELLLLKVLANVDAFNALTGAEMRRLGTHLDATPLVFGLRSRSEGRGIEVGAEPAHLGTRQCVERVDVREYFQ